MKKITKLILLLLISYQADTKTITCLSVPQILKAKAAVTSPSDISSPIEMDEWVLATRFKL